jgi:hypothetical protein
MLVYVALFLISLTIAVAAVWLYHSTLNMQGFNRVTVSSPWPTTKKQTKAQQSFNSSISLSRQNAKYVTLPNSKDSTKTPWCW